VQLAIPLTSGDRTLGVIAARTRRGSQLREDAARILTILADNLVVALEHDRSSAHAGRPGEPAPGRREPAAIDMLPDSIVHDVVQPVTAALAMLESTIDIRHVIQHAIELVDHEFNRLGLNLACYCVSDLPPVAGDADALERVFVNLLVNARDAMAGRTGTVTVTIEAAPDEPAGAVVVRVRDTGPGISDAVRAQVFEPHVTTKDSHGHRGLGLSICQEIVTRQGGTIDLEPVEGEGACFRVSLPALA
jgi:signal transduction histidine kinase